MICDDCFWVASAIGADKFDTISCPLCSKRISSTPLADNESYSYNYDERRGVEVDFHSIR